MSKEGTRKCPDCNGDDFYALFSGKGDGNCSYCHGKGEVWSIGEGLEVFRLDIEKVKTCKTCSGTGQCQTCGGTGYQYYDQDNYESSDNSYKEEKSNISSGADFYSSSDYKQYTQKSSGDSSLSGIVGLIIFIVVGAIIFENTCGSDSKRINQKATVSTICPDCNASRILEISEKCSFCNGRGNFVCKVCNGTKNYACGSCQRAGLIRCHQCDGNVNLGYIDCRQCNKNGYIFDDNDNKIDCPSCKGKRIRICVKCQGFGYLDCPRCKRNGYWDCNNCKGVGNLKCSHCSTSGKIYSTYTCGACTGNTVLIKSSATNKVAMVKCNNCAGVGSVESKTKCRKCEGRGNFVCVDCNAIGKGRCSKCWGTGTVLGPKTNWENAPCPSCSGTGKFYCNSCRGEGHFNCKVCEGNGAVLATGVCEECNGSGQTSSYN